MRIDRSTNHTLLTPHIGRAGGNGLFEIVARADAQVAPDPYLAQNAPVRLVDVPPPGRAGTEHLRVVK